MRDLSGAIARLEVAFKDASFDESDDDMNLDEAGAMFEDRKDIVSSPNSNWFKDGMPDTDKKAFEGNSKKDIEEKLAQLYPQVKK